MDAAPPTDDNLLLLSLGLSDDSEPEEAADPTAANNNNNAPPPPPADSSTTRADRTALSEDAYQALKQSYRPKLENGNVRPTRPRFPSPFSDSRGSLPRLKKSDRRKNERNLEDIPPPFFPPNPE